MAPLVRLHCGLFIMFITVSISFSVDNKRPFRINKLNVLWQKVKNKMSANKLEDLKQAFEQQDISEMKWKELKAHGGDASGEVEAKLRRNLFRILDKFGFSKYVDPVDKEKSYEDGVKDNSVRDRTIFGDKRLEQLWKLVNSQGKFSKDELDDLKTEFEHHKEKIDEYSKLLNILHKQHDISDNSVFIHERMKEHELEGLKSQMKDKHEEMNDDYVRLKEKTMGEKSEKEFKDYRVVELWERALERGFSKDELHSIKEELKHFDHKISKHEHFRKQVQRSESLIQQGQKQLSSKHQELKKKEKEHGRYVKKLHSVLLDRVSHRNEL